MPDPGEAFEALLAALDHLEIHYMVGGSGASSAHGQWRATGDIDVIVSLTREGVSELVTELATDFYVDADQVRTALALHRSFNVIHLGSAFKFDHYHPIASKTRAQS